MLALDISGVVSVTKSLDSFNCRSVLTVDGKDYVYYSIPKAEANGLTGVSKLPYSMKVLLENLLRNEDGRSVTKKDIQAVAEWLTNKGLTEAEIAYRPARVLMQDFTGVPAVVDLAAMRDAMVNLGGDPEKINPLVPVDLVIDHSVIVDEFGTPTAFARNVELEYERNGERYRFAWDQGDRLAQQQDLDGSARRYAYDALDNLAAVEYVPSNDAPSIVHRLERDAAGRLRTKVTDDGRTDYTYDPLDQLTAVTFIGNDETTQALAFAYDARGQLLIEQSAAGSLNYHYDELGNLIQTQLPDGRWLVTERPGRLRIITAAGAVSEARDAAR